jgi:hypothetical protein
VVVQALLRWRCPCLLANRLTGGPTDEDRLVHKDRADDDRDRLGLIALRPLLVPPPSYAAKKIEYKVVDLSGPGAHQRVESRLTELGNDGWDLAAVVQGVGVTIMKR